MRTILAGLSFVLGGCVAGSGAPPPLPPLAEDRAQPVLALFEHVLTGYFARVGATGPTTCAQLTPGPLTAEQERELIARFVRLAPAARCLAAAGGPIDAITREPAALVQVYDVRQADTATTAWAAVPGAPAIRYTMRFDNGAWRFDSDPRLIAE